MATEVFTYDPIRHQPTAITMATSSGQQLGLTYGYCPSGNCAMNNGNVQTAGIVAPAPMSLNLAQNFGYDKVNRLTSVGETGGIPPEWTQGYSYDQWGNRAVSGSYIPNTYTTPTGLAQYTNNQWMWTSPSPYDGNGNLTSLASRSFTYDAENRMTASVQPGMGAISYVYDGQGRRVQKSVATQSGTTTVTTFIYDGTGALAAEYGAPTTTGTEYLLADALGSTRLVLDGNGVVTERLDYLPFGEELAVGVGGRTTPYSGGVYPSGPDIESQKFTGKERDAETGLDFFGARYFSGAQGRFITPDWSDEATPVPYADLHDPQSLNLYTYGRNNPLTNADTDGHFWAELKNWVTYGHWVGDADLESALGPDAAGYRETLRKQGAVINGQPSDEYLKDKSNKQVVDVGRDFEYRVAMDQVPSVPSPGVRSSISRDRGLSKLAEEAGRNQDVQRSLDNIVDQLGKGNLSPGTGTKPVFGNILEARAASGARVYFRVGRDGVVEILAKSSKGNQTEVIQRLTELYGK